MKRIDELPVGLFNQAMEELGYYDDMLLPMDDLGEYITDPVDAIARAYYGRNYGHDEPFNPNCDWFHFNGYANLVSVESYWIDDYQSMYESELIGWLDDNGLLDEYILDAYINEED